MSTYPLFWMWLQTYRRRGQKLKIPSLRFPTCESLPTPHCTETHAQKAADKICPSTGCYRVCFPNKGFPHVTAAQRSGSGTRPHQLICRHHSGFPRGPRKLTLLKLGEVPPSPTPPIRMLCPLPALLLSLGPHLMSYFRIRSNTEDRRCCVQASLSVINLCIKQYSRAWPLSRVDTEL